MPRVLPKEDFYRIRAPEHFFAAMRADVRLLAKHRAYLALSTVIMCCLDALAAGSGEATRGKFTEFVKRHFPDLCRSLGAACPGKIGSELLYDSFRNGFTHLRRPKAEFAIAEDHELDGEWADKIRVEDAVFVAINIDRLAREFLLLLDVLEETA